MEHISKGTESIFLKGAKKSEKGLAYTIRAPIVSIEIDIFLTLILCNTQ